jgi:hypothetical protein
MRPITVALLAFSVLSASALVPADAQNNVTTPRPPPLPPAEGSSSMPNGPIDQWRTIAQAQQHCPTDTVVWIDQRSHLYHYEGSSAFGRTKIGAYMCEQDSSRAGFRAAKNEKPPAKLPS